MDALSRSAIPYALVYRALALSPPYTLCSASLDAASTDRLVNAPRFSYASLEAEEVTDLLLVLNATTLHELLSS